MWLVDLCKNVVLIMNRRGNGFALFAQMELALEALVADALNSLLAVIAGHGEGMSGRPSMRMMRRRTLTTRHEEIVGVHGWCMYNEGELTPQRGFILPSFNRTLAVHRIDKNSLFPLDEESPLLTEDSNENNKNRMISPHIPVKRLYRNSGIANIFI